MLPSIDGHCFRCMRVHTVAPVPEVHLVEIGNYTPNDGAVHHHENQSSRQRTSTTKRLVRTFLMEKSSHKRTATTVVGAMCSPRMRWEPWSTTLGMNWCCVHNWQMQHLSTTSAALASHASALTWRQRHTPMGGAQLLVAPNHNGTPPCQMPKTCHWAPNGEKHSRQLPP